MAVEGYNGWPSYETWAVALWLGNDEETQRDVEHIAAAWDILSRDEGGTLAELADEIARYVDDLTEIESVRQHASLASDLLAAALGNVDWHALARAYAAELADDAELARRQRRYLDRLAAGSTTQAGVSLARRLRPPFCSSLRRAWDGTLGLRPKSEPRSNGGSLRGRGSVRLRSEEGSAPFHWRRRPVPRASRSVDPTARLYSQGSHSLAGPPPQGGRATAPPLRRRPALTAPAYIRP